jgi:hypothetical protein
MRTTSRLRASVFAVAAAIGMVLLLGIGDAAARSPHRDSSHQKVHRNSRLSDRLACLAASRFDLTENGRGRRSHGRRKLKARASRSCVTSEPPTASIRGGNHHKQGKGGSTQTPPAEAPNNPGGGEEPTDAAPPSAEESATAPVETPTTESTPPVETTTPVETTPPVESGPPVETTPPLLNEGGSSSPKPGSIYWGAWIGSQLTGEESPWDMNAVSKFEAMADKKLSIVQFGSPFANCSRTCYFYEFPTTPMQSIRQHGSIPFLSWSSQSLPTQTSEPDYQLGDVADGSYDSYIRKYARAAAAWGHPFFLRFNWEMNGNWFPWGAGANGNNAAQYVAAWRHVHDIFTEVGATNATWVWCPNVDPDHEFQNLSSLYPGNEYVDWTCLDGYNWGTNPAGPWGWGGFEEIFRSTYNEITTSIAPDKPMIVGETASSEYGGSKANWISEALNKLPTAFPKIHGLLWFEKYDGGMDWPIETSTSATSAFAAGIQNPVYATNSFANLGTSGPIQPPVS